MMDTPPAAPAPPGLRRRIGTWAAALCVGSGCGGFFGVGSTERLAPRESLPIADPGYPAGYRRWPTADPVPDENGGILHRLYRAPDAVADRKSRFSVGAVLVKEHVVPGEDDLVVRLDVRRRLAAGTYGGWEYESYDPATAARLEIDAEACDLCHQTSPGDGTFTRFGGR